MKYILVLWLACFISYTHIANCQTINNLDCIGATAICNNIYVESEVPRSEGFFPNEINPSINCGDAENLAIWYTFTVDKSGDFGFVITPNNLATDYDWTLFDLTNHSCSDIFFEPSMVVSCNAAGGAGCQGITGATGASNYDNQGQGCFQNPPSQNMGLNPFNDLIPVQAGNTYVLYVSNWNSEPGGYTIDFSPSGDIGIIDSEPPTVQTMIEDTPCFISEVTLQFSENIRCESFAPENITIDGQPSIGVNISSANCDAGGQFEREFVLEFDQVISTTGIYDLNIIPTAAFPIYDLCDNGLQSTTLSFTIENEGESPTLLDVVPDNNCQINEVTISFSQDIVCETVDPNSFTVTDEARNIVPGSIVTSNCENSNNFVYRFDSPIVENGDYSLFINVGADIDLKNECYRSLTGILNTSFSKLAEDDVDIDEFVITGECAVNEIEINFNQPLLCDRLTDDNIEILYQGQVLDGMIVQDNCTGNNPMIVDQVIYSLDQPIATNDQYDIMIKNDNQTLITECGAVVMPFESSFTLDLTLSTPTITGIDLPQDCNIQEMTIQFSEPVNCHNAINDVISFTYGGRNIGLSPLSSDCGIQDNYALEYSFALSSVINEQGDYSFNFMNDGQHFLDVCLTPTESIDLAGGLTDFDGCDSCFIYIPNAFSPNNDRINDAIQPLSNCDLENVSLKVFDRWGELVYDATSSDTISWNGFYKDQALPEGVYAYVMEIELMEFRQITSRTRKGTFTILR